MKIDIIDGYDRRKDVEELFNEYTEMLVENVPEFRDYLNLQNYDEELLHLENKYGRPYGRLFILCCDGEVAGSIAIRKIDEENCELKRLFIRPRFRRKGFAEKLVKLVISEAREIGYSHILLDTLPILTIAIEMYKKLGFYEIKSYNNNPMDDLLYLKRDI